MIVIYLVYLVHWGHHFLTHKISFYLQKTKKKQEEDKNKNNTATKKLQLRVVVDILGKAVGSTLLRTFRRGSERTGLGN